MIPHFVQSPLLRSVPGVYHAFVGIDPVRGRTLRDQLREVFSVPASRLGTLRQVHSAVALEMVDEDAEIPGRRWRDGDALWTASPDAGVGVRTADCVPILLAHPDLPVCAAIHAGGRGMADGVIGETIRCIGARMGQGAIEALVAAAGPCARGCCYEVGEEAAERLRACPGGAAHLVRGKAAGKWNADLQSIAVESLLSAGLSRIRAGAAGPCTICSPRFHSYRREKSLTGRQLSFIYRWDFPGIAGIPPGQDTR